MTSFRSQIIFFRKMTIIFELKCPDANFQHFTTPRSHTTTISFQWFIRELYREMVFWTQWRHQKYVRERKELLTWVFFVRSNLLSTSTYFDVEKVWTSPLIRPVSKSFFKIHDPTGLRYLFQLRLRLSPLKGHKYRHNFLDTPSGNCHCNQSIEDTSHFLLSCPPYTTQRASLVASVKEIPLKVNLIHLEDQSELYLYDDPSIIILITKLFSCRQ